MKKLSIVTAFSCAFLLTSGIAFAQSPTPPPSQGSDEMEAFLSTNQEIAKLGSSLTEEVVSSTKTAQRGAQAPAVITVVTADEIQSRGYSNLAEILSDVPGFYDVYDLVTHNMGVRGVNGGNRASGSVIKLMIDGLPVDYEPTTGNFFGEELIPLPLIERVEIIRGPASALYGADAFLGVVNIITKTGKTLNGTRVMGMGSAVRSNFGGGGGLIQGFSTDNFDMIVGAQAEYFNRSGLTLPLTSPILATNPITGSSQNDISRPKSFFARSSDKLAVGEVTLLASIQNLDASGEFQDTSPLTHGTRIGIVNQNYRLGYNVKPSDSVDLRFAGTYLTAGPTSDARINIGNPDYVMLPSTGVHGFGVSAETEVRVIPHLVLTGGADFTDEVFTLQTFNRLYVHDILSPDGSTVIQHAGTVVPGSNYSAEETFLNFGAYVQAQLALGSDFSAVAGARIDDHTLYGVNPSFRAGFVYAPESRKNMSLKLLYGSSFKAPSAEQLFTQPMRFLDIEGNSSLQAQTAHTVELAGGYGFAGGQGEITLNVFGTDILNRVEYLQQSLFLQAQNIANEYLVGGELDLRYAPIKALALRLSSGVARTVSESYKFTQATNTQVTNALYPAVQAHGSADWAIPFVGLHLFGEVTFISERSASQSNAVLSGSAYTLPAYVTTSAALSTGPRKFFGDRETTVSLRCSNLLNTIWSDSGFAGVDVPAQGRTFLLTLVQAL
jgi:iron complex outermembrane receptor protein